jgi:hypothetical protein
MFALNFGGENPRGCHASQRVIRSGESEHHISEHVARSIYMPKISQVQINARSGNKNQVGIASKQRHQLRTIIGTQHKGGDREVKKDVMREHKWGRPSCQQADGSLSQHTISHQLALRSEQRIGDNISVNPEPAILKHPPTHHRQHPNARQSIGRILDSDSPIELQELQLVTSTHERHDSLSRSEQLTRDPEVERIPNEHEQAFSRTGQQLTNIRSLFG